MKKFKEPLPSGGVPFFADDFLMLQAELLKASLYMYSSLNTEVILSGCEPTLSGTGVNAKLASITSGYVLMRDKLNGYKPEIYFVPATDFGTAVSTLWIVPGTDEVLSRTLKTGFSGEVIVTKKAQLITPPSAAPDPADPQIIFNPLPSVNLKDLLFRNSRRVGEIIPLGLVPPNKSNPLFGPNNIPWFLQSTLSPTQAAGLGQYGYTGFAICNGNNSTPDLRRRFLTGMDLNHSQYDAVGKIGGTETVSLTAEYIPSHNHILNDPGHYHWSGEGKIRGINKGRANLTGNVLTTTDAQSPSEPGTFWHPDFKSSVSVTNITMSKTGGSQAHENRPPFYTTLYIQRIF